MSKHTLGVDPVAEPNIAVRRLREVLPEGFLVKDDSEESIEGRLHVTVTAPRNIPFSGEDGVFDQLSKTVGFKKITPHLPAEADADIEYELRLQS